MGKEIAFKIVIVVSVFAVLCLDIFWCKKDLVNKLTNYNDLKTYETDKYRLSTDVLCNTLELTGNDRNNKKRLAGQDTVYIDFFVEENYKQIINDIKLMPNVKNIVINSAAEIYWAGLDTLLENNSDYEITLNCENSTIDFTGAQTATLVKSLNIIGNAATNSENIYSGICNLPNIEEVYFQNISSDGLEKISGSKELSSVYFENMTIDDFGKISTSAIKNLYCNYCTINNVSESMDNIDTLNVEFCEINCDLLSKLNKVNDISVLSNCPELAFLNISLTDIDDVSVLSKCEQLIDLDISVLNKCSKIAVLDISKLILIEYILKNT